MMPAQGVRRADGMLHTIFYKEHIMLVLGRKKNQSIDIGNDIRITIVSVNGNMVKVGIDAPANCTVLRGELRNAAAAANSDAENSGNNGGGVRLKGTRTLRIGDILSSKQPVAGA